MPYRPLPPDLSDVRDDYGPDSLRRPHVPRGETVELGWAAGTISPRTSRRVWIHVPARYDTAVPAGPMVSDDGWWYLDPDGVVRGAVVVDMLATTSGWRSATAGTARTTEGCSCPTPCAGR